MISGVGFRGLGLGCRVYDLGHGFRFFQGLGLRLCAPVGLRYLRLTLMHFPHLLYSLRAGLRSLMLDCFVEASAAILVCIRKNVSNTPWVGR